LAIVDMAQITPLCNVDAPDNPIHSKS